VAADGRFLMVAEPEKDYAAGRSTLCWTGPHSCPNPGSDAFCPTKSTGSIR
jgi:hypothetical protein